LSKVFGSTPVDEEDEAMFDIFILRSNTHSLFGRLTDSIVPPHFYGVMAKTELGCRVLAEKGHIPEFVQFINKHGLESDDEEIILKLKSALWAVVCALHVYPRVPS
jgi:hypothetical protein